MKRHTTKGGKRKDRNNYRLILQEEVTFAEKWSLKVKPGQLRWLAAGSVLAIIGVTYAVVALTPLREWAVPGYLSTETRQMQVEAWHKADSLSRELATQQRYIQNVLDVLEGRVQPDTLQEPDGMTGSDGVSEAPAETLNQTPTNSPSLDRLRNEVKEEDAFTIGRSGGLDDAGLWMAPVDGRISSPWNPEQGHWGVDLVAPAGSPVKACGDGTVVFAGFTAGGGHTIVIQHQGDRLSTYMHNSRLDVSTGQRVLAGDAIAVIGSSGDHSTGPHLHFEWWESGTPIDPALRINLNG